jgi:SAM-dependent methyltransferase
VLTTHHLDFLRSFLAHPLLFFTSFETFKHKSFSRLWADYGETMSQEMPPGTGSLLASVSGVVLDVGPGSGTQLHFFDPSKITKMYGVEPGVDMHAKLLENAQKCGFSNGQYEPIAAGAEPPSLIPALAKRGLLSPRGKGESGEGIFDTIACVRVLCGVPNHRETIEGLYRVLKPGGRLVICEHVVNPWPHGGGLVGRVLQKVYMVLGWWFWMGGCCLDRDTESVLKDVAKADGGWKSFEVKRLDQWTVLPHIVGEMVKR